MFLCLIGFLHDIVLDIAVGSFISSSSMDCSEIALSNHQVPEGQNPKVQTMQHIELVNTGIQNTMRVVDLGRSCPREFWFSVFVLFKFAWELARCQRLYAFMETFSCG